MESTSIPKQRSPFARLFQLLLLAVIFLSISLESSELKKMSTPELLSRALGRGEITEEQFTLYLTYAAYEWESLPVQFRGQGGWCGTGVIMYISKAAHDVSFCSMSPFIRSEMTRILGVDTVCK